MAKQTKICVQCKNEYLTFNSKQLFCSRTCYAIEDSKRKREKYQKQSHHNVGRKMSDEERKKRSDSQKESWKNPLIRNARLTSMKKIRDLLEYPLGWSPDSKQKRNETIKRKGGHNLSGKFGERQCDITFKEKYGKWSYELLNDKSIQTEFTKPEILVFNKLCQYNHNVVPQYEFRGRYFDFALPEKCILIEVDGIYWHGKNLETTQMNEIQLRTRENDLYKNGLVENSDWKLIRIWEDEINNFNFNNL